MALKYNDLRDNQPGASLARKIAANRQKQHQDPWLRLAEPNINQSWQTGYDGEVIIGNLLNTLKFEGYTVLHSIQIGERGADIDHLVISPTGRFYVINTKHHAERTIHYHNQAIHIDGRAYTHVTNSLTERDRVRNRLTSIGIPRRDVTAIIAFVNPTKLVNPSQAPIALLTNTTILSHIRAAETGSSRSPYTCPTSIYDVHFWQPKAQYHGTAATDALQRDELIREILIAIPVIIGGGIKLADMLSKNEYIRNIHLPKVHMPNVNIPKIKLPKINTAQVQLPKPHIPEKLKTIHLTIPNLSNITNHIRFQHKLAWLSTNLPESVADEILSQPLPPDLEQKPV